MTELEESLTSTGHEGHFLSRCSPHCSIRYRGTCNRESESKKSHEGGSDKHFDELLKKNE
jgi:hypothetical protein